MGPLARASAGLVVAALLALATAVGAQKIRDFDYWWHARAGQLIAETGRVPKVDPFTFTVEGRRWVDIHWLFQLGLHGVRAAAGDAGVGVAKTALAGLLVAALLPIGWRRDRAFVSGAALGAMLLLAGERFEPRPELPSFVLLAVLLLLLDRHERRGGRGVLLAVPVQLLWVNLHGLFAVGLAVLAIALAAEAVRPLVAPGQGLRRDRLGSLALALGLSVAISLVNPNGVHGLLYPIQQLEMIGSEQERGYFGSVIAELIPPFVGENELRGLPLLLFAGLAAASFAAIAANWRRAGAFDVLAWVAFLYLALGARRNVALFAVVAAPIAVRNANAALDRLRLPRTAAAANTLLAAGLLVLTADAAAGRLFARLGSAMEPGFGVFEFFAPRGAVDWIARERPPGPIYHHMASGGYLLDRLWPEYRDMVDGRLEVFGAETFARLQAGDPVRFRELDAEYRFGMALVQYSLFDSRELLGWLHLNPTWRLVYVDDSAALFVREDAASPRWPSLDVGAPDLFPPLDAERSAQDRLRRQARVAFLLSVRQPASALAVWEEAMERYPELRRERVVHAWLLRANGLAAAAETILREELAARPDDASLRAQLGDLRLEAGDVDAARGLYDEALALDPNHAYALQRRTALAAAEGDVFGAEHYGERLRALSRPGAGPLAP